MDRINAVRWKYFCKHQCGKALGWDGTTNESELLINVVTVNKPKVLIGLNQKVCGRIPL